MDNQELTDLFAPMVFTCQQCKKTYSTKYEMENCSAFDIKKAKEKAIQKARKEREAKEEARRKRNKINRLERMLNSLY